MKNRYCKSSKLSEAKFRELIKYFSVDLTAVQIARLTGLNVNTVDRYLRLIRERIALCCAEESPFSGTVEVDESYFGVRRIKGKRGAGPLAKHRFSTFMSAVAVCIQKLYQIAQKPRYKLLSAARSMSKASSILMAGGAITAWLISAMSTFASITARMSSSEAPIMSMALKVFGASPKFASPSL